MNQNININKADPKAYATVVALLRAAGLPTEDISKDLENFWIAETEGDAIGVIGMDLYTPYGLLRSMTVLPEYRNKGIASRLVDQVEQLAKKLLLSELYLITNTAESYFSKKGFQLITKGELPDSVASSEEMNGLCPASSVIMRKTITQ